MKLLLINRYYYFMILILSIGGGIVLSAISKTDVTIWINSHYNLFLDKFLLITNLGGSKGFSIIILLAIWIFKGWHTAIKTLVCFATVALIVQFTKHIIFPGELRPTLYLEGKYALRLIEGVVQLKTESFPSGHTAAAFSITTFLALLLPGKKWHWMLALAAVSVGYARLYLSQHFITDVYAGMLIAVVVTTVIYYFYPQENKRND